jgi:predicted Ser/Thr protein kinase
MMATTKQKEAAKRNIGKARQAQSARAHGANVPRQAEGMSTAEKDRVADDAFAFPQERKEPLTDARHVRNAIARFDQVEDVSDAERDQAWKRIKSAARKYDVEVSAKDWRDLAKSGKDRK